MKIGSRNNDNSYFTIVTIFISYIHMVHLSMTNFDDRRNQTFEM